MTVISVKAFGGMRPISQPRLLDSSEAQLAQNVRLVSGALAAMKGTNVLKATTSANPQTIYRYGTSATETNYWLEFSGDVDVIKSPIIDDVNDRLYWTDGVLPRYAPNNLILSGASYPGASYQLGIPKPSTAPTITGFTAPATYTVVARDYVVTFYNPTTVKESTPSSAISVQAVDGQAVSIADLPTDANGDAGVTKKRLYRKVSGTYRLVAELNLDVLTYEDTTTDATLASAAAIPLTGRPTAPKTAPVANAAALNITASGVSRQYVYTIVNYSTGSGDSIIYYTESAPSPAATISADETQTVTISALSNSLSGSFFRLYRKDPDQGNFRLINEFATNITSVTDVISKTTLGTPLSYDGPTGPGSAPTVSANASTGVSSASVVKRSYLITYLDSSGNESPVGPYSNVVEVVDGQTTVTLTHVDSVPSGVNRKRLYRQNVTVAGANITIDNTAWRLVSETTSGTTSFTDSAAQASLSTVLNNSLQGLPAAPTTRFSAQGKIPARVVPETRTYVYTYVSAYGEEGPPSDASTLANIDPAGSVTVSVPSGSPGGAYNITTKRIYRSSTVGSTAQFQFVADIPLATGTYTDTKTQAELGEVIPAAVEEAVAPPAGLKGLKLMANGVGVGFVGNKLYLSEPYLLHTWPHEYTVADEIVGLGVFGQSVVCLTKGRPVVFSGVDPSAMAESKIAVPQACVSKRSIVDMGDGVIYAAPDGLVSISSGGLSVVTEKLYSREQWQALVPSTIQGFVYNGRYVMTYDSGTRGVLVFDLTGQGAVLTSSTVNTATAVTAGFYDATTDTLYFAQGGNIVRFDRGSDLTLTWKSKLFRLPFEDNFAVAQVIAEAYPVTFKVYGDGTLRHTQTVASSKEFRLPSGFRCRDWEFQIEGTAMVTEVAIATSVAELRGV